MKFLITLLLLTTACLALPIAEKDIIVTKLNDGIILDHPNLIIEQYPEVATKDSQIQLSLNNKKANKQYDVCFQFERDNTLFQIKPLIKDNILFDTTFNNFIRSENKSA